MLGRFMTRNEQLVLFAVAGALFTGAIVLYARQRVAPGPEPIAGSDVAVEAPAKRAPQLVEEAGPILADDVLGAGVEGESSRTVTVSVVGAVARPGVYEVDEGARLQDVLDRAGGPRPEADLHDINLAATVIDGSTLIIPVGPEVRRHDDRLVLRRGEAAADRNPAEYTISGWHVRQAGPDRKGPMDSRNAERAFGDHLLDLNRAPAEELEALPGIGPVTAERIIEFRSATAFQTVDDLIHVKGIGPKKLAALRPLVTVSPP